MMKRTFQLVALVSIFFFEIEFYHNGSVKAQPIAISPQKATAPFKDQSQFVVHSIVSDICKEIFYARYRKFPDPNRFRVQINEQTNSPLENPVYEIKIDLGETFPSLGSEVTIDGPIWSPSVYRNLTKKIAEKVGLEPSKSIPKENTGLLSQLLDANALTIETENQRLSETLKNDFSNPRLHEQAALLIAGFALRDNSGNFFDITSPLSRLTTHLCLAQYLNGIAPSGINQQVAEAALFTLMNNENTALEKLGGIKEEDSTMMEWRKLLEAYNTHDYRNLSMKEGTPLAERIAWFRAFSDSVDVNVGWNKLSKSEKSTIDFARIARNERFSVELGHELLNIETSLEAKELLSVYKSHFKRDLNRNDLIDALNRLPEESCIGTNEVQVIPWGQWAFFLQRHLCGALERDYHFIDERFGAPDNAQEFLAKSKETLGALRLFPFIHHFGSVLSLQSRLDSEAFAIIQEAPEFVPGHCWSSLHLEMTSEKKRSPNGSITSTPSAAKLFADRWFIHSPLPHTAYDPESVFKNGHGYTEEFIPTLDRLHELSPYDRRISDHIISIQYDNKATYAQASETYRSVLPFATYAKAQVAESITNEPEQYERLMNSAAEQDPQFFAQLGDYFRDRKNDDKAAKYYEKGIQNNPDTVATSYFAGWLAPYYLRKGDTNRAQQVVDAAAETYSEAGLEAKVNFLSAIGKNDEADVWRKKIKERY